MSNMLDMKFDVYKAGGILIKNRTCLITRSKEKSFFSTPGGKIEEGETPVISLIRELHEELGITVTEKDLLFFGTFFAKVAGDNNRTIRMDVYTVISWKGTISPQSEIEELLWIHSQPPKAIEIASIFHHEILPRLKEQDIID